MWYGKYDSYTNEDWEDNIVKTKQLTLSDLQKMLEAQKLKKELQHHFDILFNNSEVK